MLVRVRHFLPTVLLDVASLTTVVAGEDVLLVVESQPFSALLVLVSIKILWVVILGFSAVASLLLVAVLEMTLVRRVIVLSAVLT